MNAPKKKAVKKSVSDEDMIDIITIRRIGLSDEITSGINEEHKLPRSAARKLQDAGAVKVKI